LSYVFDASSILILTSKLQEKVVDIMKENTTLSQAYYEIGNALWKECNPTKRLTLGEATEVLRSILSLFNKMKIVHIKTADMGNKTLSDANRLRITYYDAAYLTVAKELGKILITDDEKLISSSRKTRVKTSPSKIFAP